MSEIQEGPNEREDWQKLWDDYADLPDTRDTTKYRHGLTRFFRRDHETMDSHEVERKTVLDKCRACDNENSKAPFDDEHYIDGLMDAHGGLESPEGFFYCENLATS